MSHYNNQSKGSAHHSTCTGKLGDEKLAKKHKQWYCEQCKEKGDSFSCTMLPAAYVTMQIIPRGSGCEKYVVVKNDI